MKAYKPNSDQSAEVTAFADGDECVEYILPHQPDPEFPNILECFIAAKPGDRITVKGKFSGSVVNGRFDFVADGAFVQSSVIEPKMDHSQQEIEVKYVKNRRVTFDVVLHLPIPKDWISTEWPRDMYAGYIHAKELSPEDLKQLHQAETPYRGSRKSGVGSVAVVVNVSQSLVEQYNDAHWDMTIGNWKKHRESKIVRKSGIQPDLEVDFQRKDEELISAKRSRKHRTHFDHTRPGAHPWAKFIFYYRLQEHIDNAGCTIRPNTAQQLAPANPEKIINAAETTVGGRIRQPKKDNPGANVLDTYADAPVAPPSLIPTTEKPQPKPKKRLGGALSDYGKKIKGEASSDYILTKDAATEVKIKEEFRSSAPPTMPPETSKPVPPPKPKKMKKLGGVLNLPKGFNSNASASNQAEEPVAPPQSEPELTKRYEDAKLEDPQASSEKPALPESSRGEMQTSRFGAESAPFSSRGDSPLRPDQNTDEPPNYQHTDEPQTLQQNNGPQTPGKPTAEEDDDDYPRFELDVEGSAKLREKLEREKARLAAEAAADHSSPTPFNPVAAPTAVMAADEPLPSSRKRESSAVPTRDDTPSKRVKSSTRDFDLKKAELAKRIEESKRKLAEEQAARQAAQEAREEKKRAKKQQREKEKRELEEMEKEALMAEQALLEEQRAREREATEMEADDESSEGESSEEE